VGGGGEDSTELVFTVGKSGGSRPERSKDP
jgi:hypothetical protein